MTDPTNPDYYKNAAPFECIELSRWYPSDWGQFIQYLWRHKQKNGIEDLKKALWFARDAIAHNIPMTPTSNPMTVGGYLQWLSDHNHADAGRIWKSMMTPGNEHQILLQLETLIIREENHGNGTD